MIATLQRLWAERSAREQWLLGVMLGLFAITIFIFAVVLPIDAGIASARERLDRAALEQGQIATRVAAIEAAKRNPAAALTGTLAEAVTTAAQDVGFALDRADPQGTDRVAITIPAAKGTALFQWLAVLERRGIFAETLGVRTNADSTLAVDAVLRRRLG